MAIPAGYGTLRARRTCAPARAGAGLAPDRLRLERIGAGARGMQLVVADAAAELVEQRLGTFLGDQHDVVAEYLLAPGDAWRRRR